MGTSFLLSCLFVFLATKWWDMENGVGMVVGKGGGLGDEWLTNAVIEFCVLDLRSFWVRLELTDGWFDLRHNNAVF